MSFGKKKDPRKSITKTTGQIRDSQAALRKEKRQIDRRIYAIRDDEDKVRKTMRLLASKGMADKCRDLAASVVIARRTIRRLEMAKINIDMVDRQLEQLRADMRLSGAVETSNEVTVGLTELIRVPELAKTMRKTSKQLYKLGILEEKIDYAFDVNEADHDDCAEDEESEISRILAETTLGRPPVIVSSKSVSVDDSAAADRRAAATVGSKPAVQRDRRSTSVIEKKSHETRRAEAMLA